MQFRHFFGTLRFTKSHHWILLNESNSKFTLGITKYAENSLGDAVYIEIAPPSTKINQDEAIGVVESVKSASDITSPISGTVTEINSALIQKPSLLNRDPHGQGWICRIERDLSSVSTDVDLQLMNEDEYKRFCSTEETANEPSINKN